MGEFHFDRRHGHHHWHFEQFARYRLLDAHGDGVVRSHKQSFCLAPTDAIDMTVPGALWRPEELGFTQCGGDDAIWIREVLPTGWGDTYYQSVGGQAFDITDLPNGRYYIEVRANPLGLLYDRSAGNDVRLREIGCVAGPAIAASWSRPGTGSTRSRGRGVRAPRDGGGSLRARPAIDR